MKRFQIKPSLVLLLLFVLSANEMVSAQVKGGKASIESQGLYLKRGFGINERLRIGKTITQRDSLMLAGLLKSFGLKYQLDDSLKTIRFFRCDLPGCYTDNNLTIGDLMGTVIRRFGNPLQERALKETGNIFIAYEGVAFIIGAEGHVKEIYILPLPRGK